MHQTLYDILEVSPKASPEIIKNAYRVLAAKYHPDNQDTGNAEIFKKLANAYEALSNPASRQDYDERLLHKDDDLFVKLQGDATTKAPQTVKRRDGTDTWCTIEEHVKRKGAELASTNLKGLLLRDVALTACNLMGSDMSNAVIENVNFTGADFTGLLCEGTTFRNVDLSRVTFVKAEFRNCTFGDCKFAHCTTKDTVFQSCDFRGSSLEDASLNDTDFSNSILEGVTLPLNASYETRKMTSVNFTRCDLRNVKGGKFVTPGECDHIYFTGANLEGANFSKCTFTKCDFANAVLKSANFSGVTIKAPISFTGASLFGTDFSDAIIENADFSTCNVIDARFHGSNRTCVRFAEGFVAPPSCLTSRQTDADNQNAELIALIGLGIVIIVGILIAGLVLNSH